MKKQLFILFVLIFIAGFSSYAQIVATGGSLPQTINCTNDASNPVAGVPYDYSALINPANGSAYWYATTATTWMTNGARPAGIELPTGGAVVAAATNYMDNTTGDASPTTTTITWTGSGLAANTPAAGDPPTLFVVVEYTAPTVGCANNLKVYPIRPINAFVVDIQSMTQAATPAPAGYGALVEQCFDDVQSAVYVPGVDGSVDYDFGTNVMYYEVVAANFTGSYTPSFQISGLAADQTADLDLGVVVGTYGTNLATGVGNGTVAGVPITTNVANTSTGVSVYLRLTIHNNDQEGLAMTPITLAVDAVTGTVADPIDDVNNATCLLNTPFEDAIAQNLNPRPTVTEVAPNTFLPVAP
jgi:hypothetical protein